MGVQSAVLSEVRERDRDIAAELLGRLSKHREGWLTTKELSRDVPRTTYGRVIKRLTELKAVIDLGKLNHRNVYAARVEGQSNEVRKQSLARSGLLAMRTPGKVSFMSLNPEHDAYRALPTRLRKYIKKAVATLTKENVVLPLKLSRYNGFIFIDSVLEVAGVTAGTEPVWRASDSERVQSAYRRLVVRDRAPEVLVSDLHIESGVSLDALRAWLKGQCLAHRVVPTAGEPTAATPEQLAAALQMDGGPYLYVKFLEV